MYLVGIDIGKLKHSFCLINKETGDIVIEPNFFDNNKDGFNVLLSSIKGISNKDILIGMEDTGHYHFNLLTEIDNGVQYLVEFEICECGFVLFPVALTTSRRFLPRLIPK